MILLGKTILDIRSCEQRWFYFCLSSLGAFILPNCLARTFNTVLNRSGGSGTPCLVPDLGGKALRPLSLSRVFIVGVSLFLYDFMYLVYFWLGGSPLLRGLSLVAVSGGPLSSCSARASH